jgi:hypothetical protein
MITLKSLGTLSGVQDCIAKRYRAIAGSDLLIIAWTDSEEGEGFAQYEQALAASRLGVPAVQLVKAIIQCEEGTAIGAEAWIPADDSAA